MELLKEYLAREKDEKIELYRILNRHAVKGQILFTGSSLMERFPVDELLREKGWNICIYNRGISGYRIPDMLEHMEEMVFELQPSVIFMNIGTNDIAARDYDPDQLITGYKEILKQIRERLPETVVYLMAYYPVNEKDKVPEGIWGRNLFRSRTNDNIRKANRAVEELAAAMGCRYIDLNCGLTDAEGRLKKDYTVEGVHMNADGYRVVLDNMKPYLMDQEFSAASIFSARSFR